MFGLKIVNTKKKGVYDLSVEEIAVVPLGHEVYDPTVLSVYNPEEHRLEINHHFPWDGMTDTAEIVLEVSKFMGLEPGSGLSLLKGTAARPIIVNLANCRYYRISSANSVQHLATGTQFAKDYREFQKLGGETKKPEIHEASSLKWETVLNTDVGTRWESKS